ncbi:hypothetical protein C8Q77DRAFT_1220923 [Trametes polyzona]|nr:hypothetical protein C8Q77DRAFT_1220923 [Trametes polyzona]
MSTDNMLLFANLAIGGYDKARLPLRAKVIRSRGAGTEEVVPDGVQVLKDYIKLHPLTAQHTLCCPKCSACSNVGDGVLACTQLGCTLALCVPYGSNTAAACVEPPAGVSMAALVNTFVCPGCYKASGRIPPYRLTGQALAPLTEKRTVDRLCVVFLYLDSVHVRDHVFAALRHSMGLYNKGLVTFSTKLTITNTQPGRQEQSLAGLARQLSGRHSAGTPFVLFIATHSDPDGLLVVNVPQAAAAELGYTDMGEIAVPAGVLLHRFLGKLWCALPLGTALRGLFLIVCGSAVTNSTQFGLISRLVAG